MFERGDINEMIIGMTKLDVNDGVRLIFIKERGA